MYGVDFGKPSKACKTRERSVNWSERDKLLAVQLIIDRENELYGPVLGIIKKKAWVCLTDMFNAEADEYRTSEQLKKCFENLRSNARRYLDGEMKSKTPTPSIQVLMEKMAGSPTGFSMKIPVDIDATSNSQDTIPVSIWAGNTDIVKVEVPDCDGSSSPHPLRSEESDSRSNMDEDMTSPSLIKGVPGPSNDLVDQQKNTRSPVPFARNTPTYNPHTNSPSLYVPHTNNQTIFVPQINNHNVLIPHTASQNAFVPHTNIQTTLVPHTNTQHINDHPSLQQRSASHHSNTPNTNTRSTPSQLTNGQHTSNQTSNNPNTTDQHASNPITFESYTHKSKGKKRMIEDDLIDCELERCKLEQEKLRLDIEYMAQKRSEEQSLYKLNMEVLELKRRCLQKQLG
ncbi:uncharacterized protein LOC128243892 [Mya arenaria]|uniref:uncharacterized protein LOC128243892 n=1 Tax=Mya arenaria TaxID=6604 RepID=UPI0022E59BAE|nr:uncharacterized protein LOC128243892 [Mya arenaria]